MVRKLRENFLIRLFLVSLTVLCALFSLSVVHAADYTSASFVVKDPVLQPAGYSSSASYSLTSTIAEIAIGTSTASSGGVREVRSGFEYFPVVTRPTLSATAGNGQVSLSWTAASGLLGWTVSAYEIGRSTASGGSYTFANVGNVTASTQASLTNGTTYYFIVRALDAFGNAIATSTQVSATPAGVATPPPGGGGGGGGIVPPWMLPPPITPPPGTFPTTTPPIVVPPIGEEPPRTGECRSIADLNCDGYVDIVDFSIMYYWFERADPPRRVDLYQDQTIDIADFSVMAHYWFDRYPL